MEEGYIAATARRHGLTIITGNDKDFRRPDLKVFNPLTRPADNRRTMVSRQCPDSSLLARHFPRMSVFQCEAATRMLASEPWRTECFRPVPVAH